MWETMLDVFFASWTMLCNVVSRLVKTSAAAFSCATVSTVRLTISREVSSLPRYLESNLSHCTNTRMTALSSAGHSVPTSSINASVFSFSAHNSELVITLGKMIF